MIEFDHFSAGECLYSLISVSHSYRCFKTLACVRGGRLEVGFVSACSWSDLVTGVGGSVLAGVEIGVLSCICPYCCGCQGGGCVRSCIRAYTQIARTHARTHKLLGYLM